MIRRCAIALFACVTVTGCGGMTGAPKSQDTTYHHKIEGGDTLESVARQYYLDPAAAARLGEINHVDDDDLSVGMTLLVPMTSREVKRLKTREQARIPYNQGLALAKNAAYIDAVERFGAAIEVDDSFADAYYNTGVSLQMMKSYDKATTNFKNAIRRDPHNAEYEFALGNCDFYRESYQSAAEAFERAIELKSGHAKAYYSLAICYEKLQRPADAKRTWQRYLELDATSVWATEARKHLQALE